MQRFFKKSKCILLIITICSALNSGCEVNPLSVDPDVIDEELNQTSTAISPIVTVIPENLQSPTLATQDFERFILEQIKLLENEIAGEVRKINPINGEQIQQIIQKELVTFLRDKQDLKYQFLCDENERWIYRCNRMTGEIECFSMSSNKLRLLSSTR
jgi:hypothetical protein